MFDPRNQSPDETLASCRDLGANDLAARRLLAAILVDDEYEPEVWTRRYQVPRRVIEQVGTLPRLRLDRVVASPVDGFRKLRLITSDDLALETVLIPLHKEGTATVCLSSQVGCAMGCVFCATARMTDRRSLATWEIVDQWVQARDLARGLGLRISGAVFMGMGEPFQNYSNVIASAELLRCSYGGMIAGKAVTISTVGLVPAIDRYTEEGHRFRLTISLGAAIDDKRAKLVPVASRWPIAEVMAAAKRHAQARRQRVNLAYVCISGVNCGDDDAEALGREIGDTPVRLDLIDVTDPTGRFAPPTPDELETFRNALTRHVGQPVVRRYSGGKDIQAACGTLAASD